MTETRLDVFCLTDADGRFLPPATQGTVLAKYSRSPLSARDVLSTLTKEEASKFQDKWLVTYSHSSVGELSYLPVCYEGVSIVASKFIEGYQRMGYSEKSTRYQQFSRDSFVTPPGCPSTMREFAARYYDAYDRLMPRMVRRASELMGMDPGDSKVRARAFDNLRYLLPAGTGTSLGAVGFARDFRYLVQDAGASMNPEIRAIGEATRAAISDIAPVLMNKTDPNEFEPRVVSLGPAAPAFDSRAPSWYVDVLRRHTMPDPALTQKTFETLVANRYGMSWTAFSKHMDTRGARQVPKVFRTVKIGFDVMMDYGAYRDLQRHRRCDQYAEPLTPNYGYLVPDDIAGTDMEPEYREAMESVSLYEDERVVNDPDLMQYMVPLGYLHRSAFEMDLQELYYIVELRTKPQGHISYRRVAYEMYKQAAHMYPELMRWCAAVVPDSIGVHT